MSYEDHKYTVLNDSEVTSDVEAQFIKYRNLTSISVSVIGCVTLNTTLMSHMLLVLGHSEEVCSSKQTKH